MKTGSDSTILNCIAQRVTANSSAVEFGQGGRETEWLQGGVLSLKGWESSHLSFLIDPLDDGSRLLTVVKQSDSDWVRETFGDEAGDAADMGPIEISLEVVREFVNEVVAHQRWVLDYASLMEWDW